MFVIVLLVEFVIIGILWGFLSYEAMRLDLFVKSTTFGFNLFLVSIHAKEDA